MRRGAGLLIRVFALPFFALTQVGVSGLKLVLWISLMVEGGKR